MPPSGLSFALLVTALLGTAPAAADRGRISVGVRLTDASDPSLASDDLRRLQPIFLHHLRRDLSAAVDGIGRFETLNCLDEQAGDRSEAAAGEPCGTAVDAVAHLSLRKLAKGFRNKTEIVVDPTIDLTDPNGLRLAIGGDPRVDGAPAEAGAAGRASGGPLQQTVAEPVIALRFELRLTDGQGERTLYSQMVDTAAVVPYDSGRYLYNPEKYGHHYNDPALVRRFLRDFALLDDRRGGRSIQYADRWFISLPEDDAETARRLIGQMTAALAPYLDANLPITGRIAALGAGQRVTLDVGRAQGLFPGLRLDARRPPPCAEKVGQVEVDSVFADSAQAHLRKLEGAVRRRGEGLAVGDVVVSERRRVRPAP